MGSYFSLHPVPFPLWGLDKRVKQRAAQMMNVVGCLIITHPSSPSFSLHPQGSHLLLTPHLPHISLSKHMLTFYSQRRASAALKPHTHTHTPPFFISVHTHTYTCCNCRRSGGTICTVEFTTSWWLREKRW